MRSSVCRYLLELAVFTHPSLENTVVGLMSLPPLVVDLASPGTILSAAVDSVAPKFHSAFLALALHAPVV